jgi:serine O-acetyltransferase
MERGVNLYRLGNWFYRYKIPFLSRVCDLLIRLIHNCAVFSSTDIGKGTTFGYGGIGVVIHKRAVIGKNCTIGTGVTIGGRSKSIDVPYIGNDVYIATGAKVLGPITVGDNVVIGANAVVIENIPSDCIVAGVPARVIKSGITARDYF